MTIVTVAKLPDFKPAPNQGGNIELYEVENRALDPDGHVLAAMRARAPWAGRTLLDLGCGSGYWLRGYADEAAEVIGVEPDSRLLPLAADRDPRVRVLHGSAEHIPLGDQSVDVVHARFAYFFPPGCDAGLAEVTRVLRPGGTLVVIGNDLRAGEFAELLQRRAGSARAGWRRGDRRLVGGTRRRPHHGAQLVALYQPGRLRGRAPHGVPADGRRPVAGRSSGCTGPQLQLHAVRRRASRPDCCVPVDTADAVGILAPCARHSSTTRS